MRGGEARDGVNGGIVRGAQRAGHAGVTKGWVNAQDATGRINKPLGESLLVTVGQAGRGPGRAARTCSGRSRSGRRRAAGGGRGGG
jgi:hypothetical protein